jgi:N-glycosidase YbiA
MAVSEDKRRIYIKKEVIFFRTTTGEFGPLSNMAPDYPLFANDVRIPTAEALYQACRFPDEPEIQCIIIDQISPMTAKMKSKKYRDRTREDWDSVRVNIMRWCLRLKLSQNWARFGAVLERTVDKPIVEESVKDAFWGAMPKEDGTLVGMNALGRLLMELRKEYLDVKTERKEGLTYPDIPHLLLLGRPLEVSSRRFEESNETQATMFE